MRSTQIRSKSVAFAVALTAVLTPLFLTAACGGGPPTPAAAPNDTVTTADGKASPASASASLSEHAGSVGAGSTTTALPPNGELQGAKLRASTHSETETKGDAGPNVSPGHSQEAGRRREDIQTVVMLRRDEARACYDRGLKDHPSMEGDLTVKFVLDPQGVVTDASVDASKSSIHEPSVESCVVDVLKRLRFAASKGGFETRATYPFNFHPKTFGKPDAGAK